MLTQSRRRSESTDSSSVTEIAVSANAYVTDAGQVRCYAARARLIARDSVLCVVIDEISTRSGLRRGHGQRAVLTVAVAGSTPLAVALIVCAVVLRAALIRCRFIGDIGIGELQAVIVQHFPQPRQTGVERVTHYGMMRRKRYADLVLRHGNLDFERAEMRRIELDVRGRHVLLDHPGNATAEIIAPIRLLHRRADRRRRRAGSG